MQTIIQINPRDITILPERARKAFPQESQEELKASIKKNGLIHPIVVRLVEGHFVLAAGERRLRACKELIASEEHISCLGFDCEPGNIPAVEFTNLNHEAAMEVELDENIQRVNLTWQERVEATARLHKYRMAHESEWNLGDTAREMDQRTGAIMSPTAVHNRVLLAGALSDPAIAAMPTEAKAMQALLRKYEQTFANARGTDLPADGTMRLECIHAINGMLTLETASIDVIVTDPPYGIDVTSTGINKEAVVKHDYDDTWDALESLMTDFAIAAFRACKPDAHIYVFCDFSRFHELSGWLTMQGWVVWPRPIIWAKNNTIAGDALRGPMRSYECILFAQKGDRPVTAAYRDVVQYSIVQDREHAAQKPVELYIDLLRRSSAAGETVLDPFCGSGTVFLAAKQLRLKAIGFDNNPGVVVIAARRIKDNV